MPQILDTDDTNAWTSQITEDAGKYLVVVCPVLRINARLRKAILSADSRNVNTFIIHGRGMPDKDSLEWLKGLKHSNVSCISNLNVRLHFNEKHALMTSMSIHEFPQAVNEELGVLVSSKDDKAMFKDVVSHALRLIEMSEREHGPWDIRPIRRSVEGLFGGPAKTEPPRPQLTRATSAPAPSIRRTEPDHPASKVGGHCIRCGAEMAPGNALVYCTHCFEEWSRNPNIHYVEPKGVCCICGKPQFSSPAHPSCAQCFEAEKDIVMSKSRTMKSFENRG